MTTRFTTKAPGEEITVSFDYRKLGAPSSPDVQVVVLTGTDPTPNAIKSGTPFLQGSDGFVYQRIVAGVDGVDYGLLCYALVNGGPDKLLIDAILPVRERPTPRT